ncbi:hypothetical protein DFJ58DRAFT_843145 [Suillus subalutaceus]|uniref:uncharacterized protein n=1 Tax=Suillus subalutaceus TaxID=48586 RepID=UPI001B860F07|nr:uncharacterized protein DFJ58DRAFT_843145 [Suillus subalutaceus]KAG1842199.1 hypothetical protein F4604DRAFT_1689999 [Suillus subluteus]KAG1847503.1 hypothetical protein DFJ58DRAFT_843145 [Suillus subalutaceus]
MFQSLAVNTNPFQRKEHDHERNRTSARRRFCFFSGDKNGVAGVYNAALSNPKTSGQDMKHAKQELDVMERDKETHLPFMTKVKRALGICSSPHQKQESNRRPQRRSALV